MGLKQNRRQKIGLNMDIIVTEFRYLLVYNNINMLNIYELCLFDDSRELRSG